MMRTFGCVSAWKYHLQSGLAHFLTDCAQQNALLELKFALFLNDKLAEKRHFLEVAQTTYRKEYRARTS